MSALDLFCSIPPLQKRVDELEAAIASAYSSAGPKGQQFGSIGGSGGSHDALAGVDRVIDSGAVAERDSLKARLISTLERATDVLYGKSGRGGVAKAIGTDEADMLCFHYCQGESWASLGRRYNPDDPWPTQWCKRYAIRICRDIDRIGLDKLADS